MKLKLFVVGSDEVGGGLVVDVCSKGQWLGVDIPLEQGVLILVWLHSVIQKAYSIFVALS